MEEIEFDPTEGSRRVVEQMDRLAAAHDGWINLLPGVPEDAVPEPSGGVVAAVFGTAQAPVSMGTWMPPPAPAKRSGPERVRRGSAHGATVGMLHPRGRSARSHLESAGVPVPGGWTIRQDHGRRGLILEPASATHHEAVLAWMLAAGAALSAVPLTGRWKARVYLPR